MSFQQQHPQQFHGLHNGIANPAVQDAQKQQTYSANAMRIPAQQLPPPTIPLLPQQQPLKQQQQMNPNFMQNNQQFINQVPPQAPLSLQSRQNLLMNGGSNESSRTASPALSVPPLAPKSNAIPASQLPPSLSQGPVPMMFNNQAVRNVGNVNMLSSQQQSNLNNNINSSQMVTPEKGSQLDTGFTPIKSSTPNLMQQGVNQQNINRSIPNLTNNVQNLSINSNNQSQLNNQSQRSLVLPPPSMQQPYQPQPQSQPQQPQPNMMRSQPTGMTMPQNGPITPNMMIPQTSALSASVLPPPPQQPQPPPIHGISQHQQQQKQMPQSVPLSQPQQPPLTNQQPPVVSQPLTNAAFNKRPMYPTQNLQQQPRPQPTYAQPNQQHTFNGSSSNQQPLQYQTQNQYPTPHQQQPQPQQQYNNLNVIQSGFNKLWGHDTIDLLQNRHILPTVKVKPPPIRLNHHFHDAVNCNTDIFRCTLTKIPETKDLLNKSRLPLGVLIHPFRDLSNLPVIQCSTIVRCRACRTYINPFVYFVDSKKWKCNLCYRVNELPDEFQYDPVSKTYGDVTRRPEVKSSTIEFIAPSEYMLRPPQPAIYLFLLDVSSIAVQSGYLNVVCNTLIEQLENLPGDARTQVGFIAYNSAINFYNIAEGFNQPHEITVLDIDDVFLPCPDNLLINLKECKELITDLLKQLPKRFEGSHDSKSALGAALQIAFKMMSASGGRVTVFQTCLPNVGPGALEPREDPNNRSAKEIAHLGPATDFYKRLALECSGQQIAVDLFLLNSQYSDLATLSGISKFSGGCIYHFPLFNNAKSQQADSFKRCLERYITRKIGFEAVMRVRCTRGLMIHTFHGNFFVRSTDLLSLPNVNPDAGFGMQIAHEENLTDTKTVCFQAALLYTSSKGERRIRVHTLCLPVVSNLSEVMHSADTQCIIGLLTKMAVDRSLTSSLSDARDAFINATIDIFSAYRLAQNLPQGANGQVAASQNLSLLPLYISAILKHIAFRTGTSTRLDDRVFAMCEMKSLPLDQLIRYIYPDFYHLDCLFYNNNGETEAENKPEPPLLQLSAERLDSRSIFLLDMGAQMLIYVGTNVPTNIIRNLFGVPSVNEIPDLCYDLQTNSTPESNALHAFIDSLNEDKPFTASIQIIRDTSSYRSQFTEKLLDDRTESSLSYYEFLQHLRTQVK